MAYNVRLLSNALLHISTRHLKETKCFHRWVAPTLKELKRRKDALGPEPPSRRSDFLEWNYKAELFAFGKRLGEDFNDSLLRQALTEQSYIVKEEKKLKDVGIELDLALKDNSSMAEKGEQFMSQYIEQYLKTVLPKLPQRFIISIRDYLMSEAVLAHVSKNIGIDDIVLTAEAPVSPSSLCRSLKGVISALAASSGTARASCLVRDIVITQLAGMDITPFCSPEQPLQELTAALGGVTPESRIILESAKNTLLATYEVGVYVDKKLIGRGCGESPWIAEEMAALNALWRLWGIRSNRRPIPFNLELPPLGPIISTSSEPKLI